MRGDTKCPHSRQISSTIGNIKTFMNPKTIRVALVQMQCEKNGFVRNLQKIGRYINLAAEAKADIVCFPEMSITGYTNPIKHPGVAQQVDSRMMKKFYSFTKNKDIIAVAGFIEKNDNGKPFISQAVAASGELMGIYRKRNTAPNEKKWFAKASNTPIFKARNKIKFGISICADIKKEESFRDAALLGAKIVFHASAPGLYGKRRKTHDDWMRGYRWWQKECYKYLAQYAKKNKIFIASTTQCCGTIDEDFPGGMYIFSPDGNCICQSNSYNESSLICEIPLA